MAFSLQRSRVSDLSSGGALRLIVSGESQHDAGLGGSRYLAPQVLDTACFRNQGCIGLREHAAFEVDGILQSDSNVAPCEIRECHCGKGGSSNADCGECRIRGQQVSSVEN